jgi:hypothetical protein
MLPAPSDVAILTLDPSDVMASEVQQSRPVYRPNEIASLRPQ